MIEMIPDRWDRARARDFGDDDLGACVYASRLLGQDPSLVLSGGGNSSVKATEHDIFGDPVEILWVKGSGWDMASIERAGFAPLRQSRVHRLADLPELADATMASELRAASVDPSAPAPSVESILHAVLPYRFVLHSHADAVLALTNTEDGAHWARAAFGDEAVIVPYVMPGFVLARLCAQQFPKDAQDGTIGMVLCNHGLFTFADDAETAYRRHVDLVNRAVRFVKTRFDTPRSTRTGAGSAPVAAPPTDLDLGALARLRADVAEAAGHPMVLRRSDDPRCERFAARDDLERVSQVGPATPYHVLRTKRVPLLGRDVERFVRDYRSYVERHRHRLGERSLVAVDPAPRVVVDPELGVLAAGARVADAVATARIYAHTTEVIAHAEALGGYRGVSEGDLFDVEYWELEQAKLARRASPPPLSGEIALVTGAASGIGRACSHALLAQGAAVVGIDIEQGVHDVADEDAYTSVRGDVRESQVIRRALGEAVLAYGGVDIVVVNAGIFPPPEPLAELDDALWSRALDVNVTAAMQILRAAHPFLALAPRGGRVVVVGSKNVSAPGKDAAAYSASKAALTQLARVAALEWGDDDVRVNVVHPDAVFDTGLWSDGLVAERAARYGMTPQEYRTRNVLGTEITAAQVADLVVALCGPAFAGTTGAQIPVDGGNERVI